MTEDASQRQSNGPADASDFEIEAPDRTRPDEPITVRILGAPPNEVINFEAAMEDEDGIEWRSTATFRATDEGIVDLAKHAPESGSYEGVRSMGWCWSMEAVDPDQLVTALMTPEPTEVRFEATAGDRSTERTITRAIPEGVSRTEFGPEDLSGVVFEPAGSGPHPGVLVLHGSGGTLPTYSAALLAAHGFVAVALRYFGDDEVVPNDLKRIPLSYFDEAADRLRNRPDVTGERIGLVGHSRGAEVGLLLGAQRNWVGSMISYVGSGVIWDTPTGAPAWVDDGEPVPAISGEEKPTLLEGQLDAADEDQRQAATIPVEEIDGPVLLISGGKDPIWPARRTAQMEIDRLERADFEYAYDHLTYDDAGHFITPPYLPKSHHVFGGTPGGMAEADADVWPTTLEYLQQGLSPKQKKQE
ncbi:acyl-CoA thioesterase/bile acid-CoA:amino acid N-acyltransferase family protein [Saliphagus infecundisoli]|uniref:Acyl-CoA thioesterase/bile acid-CoA:amino acid N-acyltransferase family protein n=2 Tax=Saliphagus infecundisoli TaxID=1849069 RepID=A0ABD5QE79_9EURY|nr:acyl-CoA thioesterase/bile acid-CoA:amino acid N-acyltransferase family protein [Saliphagus infecundisoli]